MRDGNNPLKEKVLLYYQNDLWVVQPLVTQTEGYLKRAGIYKEGELSGTLVSCVHGTCH